VFHKDQVLVIIHICILMQLNQFFISIFKLSHTISKLKMIRKNISIYSNQGLCLVKISTYRLKCKYEYLRNPYGFTASNLSFYKVIIRTFYMSLMISEMKSLFSLNVKDQETMNIFIKHLAKLRRSLKKKMRTWIVRLKLY